jgi:hypothetical protein
MPNFGRNWDKSFKSFSPCTVTSTYGFYSPPPPPLEKNGLKLVCNVNIVYRKINSENYQDYAQKLQMKLYVHEFGFWLEGRRGEGGGGMHHFPSFMSGR